MPEAEEYTIGWICALTKELIAAKVFLDFLPDPVDNAAINDDNNYTLGSIGKHNVVIAVLPYGQYGLVNATAALKDMTRTFSNLRAVLMVGIGGGVPCENDIRLGDIVVGSVGPSSGGVIQYDYGRAIQGEEFAVTGHLNQPPMAFLTAMSALHARYEMEGHSIDSNIDRALQRYKRLGKKYKRPEASTDRLYESNFVHQGSKGIRCSELCGNDNLVHRAERGEDENNPATHCGLIASGNQLVKNALLRDKLAAKHGILCFEMEAAGLMNHFPCVLIRGICDYSDSHKNDEWQEYAAMAAAAYTKDLLLQVAPSSVQKEERIETLLGRLNEKVDDIHQVTTESSRDIKSLSSSVRDDAISRWLNSTDPSVDHNKAREACHSVGGEVFILIDALDEYQNRSTQRADLLSWIKSFHNEPVNTHLLVTSRPEHDIKTSIETWADSGSIISLKTDNVGRDISEYVCDFVTKSTSFRRWHGQTSTQDDIVNTLTAKADGVFRWVALQLERLKDCINKEEVNTTLETLPETLQETYYRVLNELTSTRRKYVIRILQFLAYSDIPMELEAAVDALAINLTAPPGSRFVMKERMPLPAEISSLCSTLFVTVCKIRRFENRAARHRATFLQLAHSSVKEFILSCPRTEFDGLLIEPTARLMITEICLVYFLEMNCFLSDEELMWTHHLLPFAVDSWIHDASCRLSRLNNFTHLSMELLSNELLFKRWSKLIHKKSWFSLPFQKQDQVFYASWSGDENCVKKLLDSSVTRDTTAWRLDPALHVASEFGHLEVAALLIREGADVNAEGEIHNVLCTAIKAGHTDIISLLIKEGADVNAQQGPYRNTFEVASKTGRLDIVELLIKPSADVNAHSSYTDALYSASLYGHLNLVMYLVEEGADVNAQGGYYGTALCVAPCFGYLNIVTYLVEKGADVNAQGGCFENALQAALTRRRDTVVKFLQNHKANLRYDDVKPSPPW
ncbi:Ankyrin repeat [Fusarium oxysporum f. sp. vasinfectum]|nr:Ankyrin repeat [Fusarium oxysporum f. sp. vasinfectum]